MINTLLPPIDRRDRDKIKLPRSFEDLKALNEVLQVSFLSDVTVLLPRSTTVVCVMVQILALI